MNKTIDEILGNLVSQAIHKSYNGTHLDPKYEAAAKQAITELINAEKLKGQREIIGMGAAWLGDDSEYTLLAFIGDAQEYLDRKALNLKGGNHGDSK